MARKYFGTISSGGVIALCAVLLLAPTARSQTVQGRRVTFIISGNVGLAGVTMQGLPGAPTTDQNGVYSVEVEYGWTGTVAPVKLGYTFDPPQRDYSKVKEAKTSEDYQYTLKTFVISGTTDQPGVKLRGLPGDPISDQSGRYSAVVDYGWTNVVTPEKEGYRFDPATRMYTQVDKDFKSDSYKAVGLKFTISGSAERADVIMKGLPGDPKTGPDGTYRVEVEHGWDGIVTPTKPGHEFIPPERTYSDVVEPKTNQNYQASVYTYKISGSANMPGVVMTGLPGDPITDSDGFYTAIVEHGWSGKVTPQRPGGGYTFDPASRSYANVTEDKENENYNPSIIRLTISGSTGIGNVKLIGLDNVVSDATGFYTTQVDYGQPVSITPEKDGYIFEPSTKVFAGVTENKTKEDFKAEHLTFVIAGNTVIPGVMLDGLPGRPVSGQDGSYSVTVNWNWSGKVTPRKPGYTFSPEARDYDPVKAPQPAADFTPAIIRHAIKGVVLSELGPVQDAIILADGDAGTTTTNADGEYELLVDHGWRGMITPNKDGYSFLPPSRSFDPVVTNVPGQSFTGNVQMLTITDAIALGDEPIADVTIKAEPGGMTTVTDAKGKYSIRVPYGWIGELTFDKPGFIFEPNSVQYTEVTDNIDNLAPARPPTRDVVGPDRTPTAPDQTTPTAPDQTTPTAPDQATPPEQVESPEALTEKTKLEQQLEEIRKQLDLLLRPEDVPTLVDANRPAPPVVEGPVVNGVFREDDLIAVLTKISEDTGVPIAVDATVKPTRVSATLRGAPVPAALQKILEGTGYTSKRKGDAYLVFRPVTNTFMGDQLRQALQDIALSAGVMISLDENVTGEVYADLNEVPVEEALEMILAGTPYVVKQTKDYFLVALRDPDASAFPQISETRQYHANYISPSRAKSLLSPAFAKFVQADTDPNSHIMTITASPDMAERIIEDLKRLDLRPRHVLLDARIVSMERGDLLQLGIEWNFPSARGGFFGDSYTAGEKAAGDINTNWPFGIQVGFSFDRTFTDSLVAALNLLDSNEQLEIISSPQLLAQDGKRSEIRVITEERYALTPTIQQLGTTGFFTQTEFETIESGTTLSITPMIGDNNDITVELAVEVSDSIPRARDTELPVVTRRQAKNSVTIRDGGTVALAGLTENRSRDREKKVPGLSGIPLLGALFKNDDNSQVTREIAVFVTARLVPDYPSAYTPPETGREPTAAVVPSGDSFEIDLREALSRQ